MRLLFVADGRSPIAQNWIRYFAERGDEIFIASTFACELDFPIERMEITPVAFSSVKKQTSKPGTASARTLNLRTKTRQWLGPLTIRRSAKALQNLIHEVKPDLIHAMRVPYEGMLAAEANDGFPLIASIWGNDFTLHAPSTPLMGWYTRRTMNKVRALHADVERDVRLARQWGLGEDKLTFVAPGNGGIRSGVFYPPAEMVQEPVVINPRGFRAYVRNESFFRAIPLVLAKQPNAKFICSSMQGEPQAEHWLRELHIEHAVTLMPPISHVEMGNIFRTAQVVVSPSIHDGTPNSLIEGMACGCFPVAGDLDSIREWITNGKNGLLVNPNSPQEIADAILLGLERQDLRRDAAGLNAGMIASRAEYGATMKRAAEFYEKVLD